MAQPEPGAAPQPPPTQVVVRRRRRRRGLWAPVLGVLLILLVVAAVGDRVAAAAAAGELRSRVAAHLASRDVGYATLDVSVGGTPFLTQVAQGRYESITIDMTEVHLREDRRDVELPALHVVATGVRADPVELARGSAAATADLVAGTAVVSYETLAGLVDPQEYFVTELAFREQDGALSATADVSVLGFDVSIEASAVPSVRDGQIELRLRDATLVGSAVPPEGLQLLDTIMNSVLVASLPALPFGLVLDALQVTPEGLAITATARAVTLVASAGGR